MPIVRASFRLLISGFIISGPNMKTKFENLYNTFRLAKEGMYINGMPKGMPVHHCSHLITRSKHPCECQQRQKEIICPSHHDVRRALRVPGLWSNDGGDRQRYRPTFPTSQSWEHGLDSGWTVRAIPCITVTARMTGLQLERRLQAMRGLPGSCPAKPLADAR